MKTIYRKLDPNRPEPAIGTVMYYGVDYAGPTERKQVPTIGFGLSGLYGAGGFGRLVRILPGHVCELDTTPDCLEEGTR